MRAQLRRYAMFGSLASILGSTCGFALAAAAPAGGADADKTAGLEQITVTARKHEETVLDVPASITAFSEQSLEKLDIRSFNDYATKTPNLSFSYGTANWGYADSHTIAIRGVSGFGTTGVYIDDTPVPDSLDPRVVDIQRIEVLKGPQGTLFGQNSLGGNVRMITVEPSPNDNNVHYSLRAGGTSGAGSADYGVDFAGTQKLIGNNFLVRAVGFYDHTGGFLHRTYPDANGNLHTVDDYGAAKAWGGSLAFRWIVTDRFEAGLRIMAQESRANGWLAPYAPNPPFTIDSLTMNRTNNIQEQARDRWYLPSLQLEYKGNGFQIHSSTSYFDRRETQIEDGSEGTRDVFVADYGAGIVGGTGMPADQPFAWSQIVNYRRTTHETRISFDKNRGFSGVAGIYLSESFSDTQLDSGDYTWIGAQGLNTGTAYCPDGGTTCPTYGSSKGWFSFQPVFHHDQALFGELYYDFGNFEATAGLRAYKQKQDGHELAYGALNFAYLDVKLPDTSQSGINPKLALSYKFTPRTMGYVSFSKGFRSGGAGVPLPFLTSTDARVNEAQTRFLAAIGQTAGQATTFKSDTLENFEVGAKSEFLNGRMVLTAAAFQMNWRDIQQTIIAPVSYITLTVNAGDARIRGGEIELQGRPTNYLDLRAGIGYSDAVITKGVLWWQPTGSRVYQVPKETAMVSGTFTAPIGERFTSFYTLSANYTGSSVSGTMGCQENTTDLVIFPCVGINGSTAGAPAERPGFKVINLRFGLDWSNSELALYANNITNERANLGDYNPESYAKHDATSGFIIPRVAILQPFNAGIEFRHNF